MTEFNNSQKEKLMQYLLSSGNNKFIMGDWIAKKIVMTFLGYGNTQMRTLERNKALNMTKVGNRKFYSYNSLIQLLNKNEQK